MKSYRYYFLDRTGQVFQAQNFDAASDESAKATAQALLANNVMLDSVEVWHVGRRIKIARREDEAVQAEKTATSP
jgi:hypothetical protein